MKTFTYGEYIKCIHTLRLNAVLQLAEENAEYNLNKPKKKDRYINILKSILQDKKEMAQFINQFVKPRQQIKEEELIQYTSIHTKKQYKTKEADLIYKLKNKEIFFLIEHQATIDSSLPYRILNYCLDIMQEWSKTEKTRKTYGYPIIVPIVIYTGKEKWKVNLNRKENQVNSCIFNRNKIELEYNVIDINKIPMHIFLEQNTIFGYMMCMKKSQKPI